MLPTLYDSSIFQINGLSYFYSVNVLHSSNLLDGNQTLVFLSLQASSVMGAKFADISHKYYPTVGSKTKLRLEVILLDFKKLGIDFINRHIAKFSKIIGALSVNLSVSPSLL
jgi:hypothetical protein